MQKIKILVFPELKARGKNLDFYRSDSQDASKQILKALGIPPYMVKHNNNPTDGNANQ